MKKILTFFILITITMLMFTVCVHAETIDIETDVSVSTVYEKALEWWRANENEITSFLTMTATALFGIFYSKIKLGINDLIVKNGSLINANANSNKVQGELIVGYNSQVDEIKTLRAENAELTKINEQNAADIEVIKSEIAHIAHILTTVYTNSKALPQGVKDIVTLECAECIRKAGATTLILGDGINEDDKTD